MCLACIEYIKGNLKLSELKGNLREMKEADPQHVEQIQTLIYDADNEGALKDRLKSLQK